MEAKAIAKGVGIAPRKARLVIDLIRGKNVIEADKILNNLNKDNLYVKEAFINEGRTLKRMRFGSRGHVEPIKKRTSHITIVVSDRN